MDSELQFAKTVCEKIIAGAGSEITWNRDDRFNAVVSQFSVDVAKRLCGLLEEHFSTFFTSESLPGAAPAVGDIANAMGGLDPNQKLFMTDAKRPAILVAAWWPWPNGKNVSLRLKLTGSIAADSELQRQLFSWFSI